MKIKKWLLSTYRYKWKIAFFLSILIATYGVYVINSNMIVGMIVVCSAMIVLLLLNFIIIKDFDIEYYKGTAELYSKSYENVSKEYSKLVGLVHNKLEVDAATEGKILMKSASGATMPNHNFVNRALSQVASEVKKTDTLVIVRIDHEKESWYLRVVGASMHISTAKFVADELKQKYDEMAEGNGLIVKDSKVYN